MSEGMDSTTLLVVSTIVVAVISLLGNALQFIFPQMRGKTNRDFEMAQTLDSITDAYDKLFDNLKERIGILEEEVRGSQGLITELKAINKALEATVNKQIVLLDEQREELARFTKRYKEGK